MKSTLSIKPERDIPAGIVVFLVALPLCLGVALASGAPLLSGIISGIIGGIIVGLLSESPSSVSGPAAGLAAVVFTAIEDLGSFEIFLAAVVLAGIIQVIAGILKAGFVANYIPSNVIKGLLAAIGLILILKQIPHALGYDMDAENDFSFTQPDGENTFTELLKVTNFFKWGAMVVMIFSFAIMLLWEKTSLKKFKFISAPLVVVFSGVLLNLFFKKFIPGLFIEATHTVNLPMFSSVSETVNFPLLKAFANYRVWIAGFTIAIIASLETLLNLEAVENLDPRKVVASPNKELIAQGVGNTLSGIIGGIPITSVIVRSSVNINAGAQTKLSTIFHGGLLLASMLFLAPVLNLIPLSSLATILIFTGYKLAKKELFIDMYKQGMNQFIPFMATVLGILFTDLLFGIIIGSVVSIFYVLKSNFRNPYTVHTEKLSIGDTIRIELSGQVSFFSKETMKKTLWDLPEDAKVILDATYTDFIDHDILELIKDFKDTVAVERNIRLNIIGLKNKFENENQLQFTPVLDKETQQKFKPSEILDLLKSGNKRFVEGISTEKYLKQQMTATSTKQNPIVAIVSCIDSRTSPELIFDTGLGDIVSIRIAGNIINKEIIESLELSCKELGTRLIVVLGHAFCGAVAYTIHEGKDNALTANVSSKINRAVERCDCERSKITENRETFDEVIKGNVKDSMNDILTESPYLKDQTEKGNIGIVCGYYDTTTGEVNFMN